VIRSTPSGVEITVRVIPRARQTGCAGERDGALLIRLAAPPVEGAANDSLVGFLAEALQIPRRSVRITSGERSRRKRVVVQGLPVEDVRERLLR
jgi:uncharacterized protein